MSDILPFRPNAPARGSTVLQQWLQDNIEAEFPDVALPDDEQEREAFLHLLYTAGKQYIVWCRTCRALMNEAARLGEPMDMDAIRMRVTILVESAEMDAGTPDEESELW